MPKIEHMGRDSWMLARGGGRTPVAGTKKPASADAGFLVPRAVPAYARWRPRIGRARLFAAILLRLALAGLARLIEGMGRTLTPRRARRNRCLGN
ncbi:hypothetical protein EIM48_00630 [Pseudoxanthomonas sp. SGNA-20]|uniref:hypothetical protein n=1 Tax=unclassified Pseudoxanthomonas TaxID=2645906 RepID=UPI000F629E35|nr:MULTISPECIES: hypothetical protein [unclassified Pseudoxanthomonas]RRN58585.1 hypothetical protein EIM48_00630 [Pseudoxanthomonas sp. SGNA-20]